MAVPSIDVGLNPVSVTVPVASLYDPILSASTVLSCETICNLFYLSKFLIVHGFELNVKLLVVII